jgi:pyruvate kinase
MRKAKIICTLGPASDSAEVIEGMIRAGMDVARLNFSHGTQADHARRFHLLHKLSRKLKRPVAVLQDVQGPKIRVGRFAEGQVTLATGQIVTVTTRPVVGGAGLIPTPVRSLPKEVRRGDPILLDDGRIRLEVLQVRGTEVSCKVVVGGTLKDHKGLNLPCAAVGVQAVTEKDEEDLAFGQQLGVDYVALSFVRTAKDVLRARPLVARHQTPLIAKIEKPQAIANLEEIARVSDGVMVARGDLGVEMPLEQLPRLQKQAVELVNRQGGLVIVATEMLESMIQNARPTRAEVTDVANAVLDGADAVMLSGETAAGKHPVEAVATMARIVEEIERGPRRPYHPTPELLTPDIAAGVAAAAVAAANQLKIDTLVAYTEGGRTARLISELRPEAQILALTPNEATLRRMALYWGVQPKVVARLHSTDAMLRQVRRLCRAPEVCGEGQPVVIVAGVPLNESGRTNMMSIHRI